MLSEELQIKVLTLDNKDKIRLIELLLENLESTDPDDENNAGNMAGIPCTRLTPYED